MSCFSVVIVLCGNLIPDIADNDKCDEPDGKRIVMFD